MQQIYYRNVDINRTILLKNGKNDEVLPKYEIIYKGNAIAISPHVTKYSIYVAKTVRGRITIPKKMLDTTAIKKLVRLVKEDDGTMLLYPVGNGRCEFCNSENNLIDYETHKICRECAEKIANLLEISANE